MTDNGANRLGSLRLPIGFALGPGLFLLVAALPAGVGPPGQARLAAAVTLWMAVWWITEAIPIPATALLPVVLFPLTGVVPPAEVTLAYANELIFLFLGGFLLSAAIQKWNLHRRLALGIILLFGFDPRRIVLGFMAATGFLSMWLSNTATALLMVPIALAVTGQLARAARGAGLDGVPRPDPPSLTTALLLGVAYAASIGGLATIIGSPPNAILVAYVRVAFEQTITFGQWMLYGLPIAAAGIVLAWLYLTYVAHPPEVRSLPGGRRVLARELRRLGPMSAAERRVTLIFAAVAALWLLRGLVEPFLRSLGMGGLSDTTVAILGALALFALPGPGGPLLTWEDTRQVPWGVLLLFGGGLALAGGIERSGLAGWLAAQLGVLQGVHPLGAILAVVALVLLLTEVTSNTSTATIFMPVTAGLAAALQVHPLLPMVGAATAASCAFMLPVATPPNAVVFSTGHLRLGQMLRAGAWLNLTFALLVSALVYWWLPAAWGIPRTR